MKTLLASILLLITAPLYAQVVAIRAGMVITCAYRDRKSTRLNSSHTVISYAVFCLKKKEHTSELKLHSDVVCRLLLEKKIVSQTLSARGRGLLTTTSREESSTRMHLHSTGHAVRAN